MYQHCLLIGLLLCIAACSQGSGPKPVDDVAVTQPEQPNSAEQQSDASALTSCTSPRPEMCIEIYQPVCAMRDTGVRCVTTPCPSSEWVTKANACIACSDVKVLGFNPGACAR